MKKRVADETRTPQTHPRLFGILDGIDPLAPLTDEERAAECQACAGMGADTFTGRDCRYCLGTGRRDRA